MTTTQLCNYIQLQFLEDCGWKVQVAWDEETESYYATDEETKAVVTCEVGSDDDQFEFRTALGRVVIQIPFPEDTDA